MSDETNRKTKDMGNRCNICVGSIDLLKFSIPPTTYSNFIIKNRNYTFVRLSNS